MYIFLSLSLARLLFLSRSLDSICVCHINLMFNIHVYIYSRIQRSVETRMYIRMLDRELDQTAKQTFLYTYIIDSRKKRRRQR